MCWRAGESPMAVAEAYADWPVYALVKARWDSLPPIDEKKEQKRRQAAAKAPRRSAEGSKQVIQSWPLIKLTQRHSSLGLSF